MCNRNLLRAVLAAAAISTGLVQPAHAQSAEPPAEGCVLLETKSFGEEELGAARDFANSYSGPTGASVDGVPFVYRSTLSTVRGGKGNRVAIVRIWMCPEAKPVAAGGGGAGGDKPDGKAKKPDKPPAGPDVPTFDPRTHELRDGKVVPKPNERRQSAGAAINRSARDGTASACATSRAPRSRDEHRG
jgi:hypothetical protein